jgi:hypothetical protein
MKFDLPTTEAILQDLRDEVPYLHAAESNGVGYKTFLNWLDNGKKDIEEGKNDSYYARFLQAVRKIEKDRIKRHTRNIGSDERSHKGSEWILERAFWKQFGKTAEIELNERVERLENKKANDNVSETKANAGEAGTKCEESPCDEEN